MEKTIFFVLRFLFFDINKDDSSSQELLMIP